jgi:hypothetical protein
MGTLRVGARVRMPPAGRCWACEDGPYACPVVFIRDIYSDNTAEIGKTMHCQQWRVVNLIEIGCVVKLPRAGAFADDETAEETMP